MKCLIATSFQGIETIKEDLDKNFECEYLPDIVLPMEGYEDVEVLVVNPNNLKFRLNENTLLKMVNLKYVLTISTGVAHIDLDYLISKNISLISLKDKTHLMNDITATAELAFLFLMAHARKLISSTNIGAIKKWDWRPFEGKQINEFTIGLLGYGRLGHLFESYCLNMGANPIYYDPNVNGGVASITNLFECCDVISIHASFTPGMSTLIDAEVLKLAKSNLHIINTARGELINETELVDFLKKNPGAHYSTDVIANESNKEESAVYKFWMESDQVTMTPHIGGMTSGSRRRAYKLGVESLIKEVVN